MKEPHPEKGAFRGSTARDGQWQADHYGLRKRRQSPYEAAYTETRRPEVAIISVAITATSSSRSGYGTPRRPSTSAVPVAVSDPCPRGLSHARGRSPKGSDVNVLDHVSRSFRGRPPCLLPHPAHPRSPVPVAPRPHPHPRRPRHRTWISRLSTRRAQDQSFGIAWTQQPAPRSRSPSSAAYGACEPRR